MLKKKRKKKKREKSSAVISIFAKTATLTRRVKMTGHISEGLHTFRVIFVLMSRGGVVDMELPRQEE